MSTDAPNTVHVDLANHEGRCPVCRLTERPLWWVGKRRLCASCTTAEFATARAVAFGIVVKGAAS